MPLWSFNFRTQIPATVVSFKVSAHGKGTSDRGCPRFPLLKTNLPGETFVASCMPKLLFQDKRWDSKVQFSAPIWSNILTFYNNRLSLHALNKIYLFKSFRNFPVLQSLGQKGLIILEYKLKEVISFSRRPAMMNKISDDNYYNRPANVQFSV